MCSWEERATLIPYVYMYGNTVAHASVGTSTGWSAQLPNPAVPAELISEIGSWIDENCSHVDIITRLRQRTVPEGYVVHTWIPG